MGVEYILFGIEEMKDIKKSLLSSQLSTLNSLQHLHNYKKLRNDEMNLKIKLKSLMEQSQNEIQVLKKLLPETQYRQNKHSGQSHFIDHINDPTTPQLHEEKEKKSRTTLESEIDAINAKLQMLQ